MNRFNTSRKGKKLQNKIRDELVVISLKHFLDLIK